MLNTLAIANYRSLRELAVPMGRLNLVTGANGSGKSNLYRALRLLADRAALGPSKTKKAPRRGGGRKAAPAKSAGVAKQGAAATEGATSKPRTAKASKTTTAPMAKISAKKKAGR